MSGRGDPDPAFLHNVPTVISSTVSSILTSTLSSASPPTTFGTSTISPLAAATSTDAVINPSEPTSIYFYKPSVGVAILFSVIYGILVPYHTYLSIWKPHCAKSVTQKHKYTIPLFIAVIISTLGFSLRVANVSSVKGRASVGLYASSSTWIIIAPIFVCATLYLLIAHLICLCLPEGSQRVFLGISPRWFGRIFIASDVLSFICQGAGSGIAASNNWTGKEKTIGEDVLLIGLSAQLATFTIFLIVLGLFCKRVSEGKDETKGEQVALDSADSSSPGRSPPVRENDRARDFGFNPLVKKVVKGMWIAGFFVEVRSIYRTIEFATGIDGYLFTHEWPLWVFEAAPMFIALLVLAIWHPVKWLQQKRRSAFLEKDTKKLAGGLAGIRREKLPR